MSFSAVLTSSNVLFAVVVYGVMAGAAPFAEDWLHRVFSDNPPFRWAWDHFIAPLIRAAMMVAFVALAYPALFGLTVAPAIGDLLAADDSRLHNLTGMLLVMTTLLPLLPFFGRHPALVLPIQGMLATAVVFRWLADYLSITPTHYWPGLNELALIVVLAFLTYHAAVELGGRLGERLDKKYGTDGLDVVIVHALQILVQAPVVLVYGYALGRQLAI